MATSKINMPIQGIVRENRNSSSVTMAAGTSSDLAISISKSGYTPLFVDGFIKNGGGNSDCVISAYYFNSTKTTLTIQLRNVSASSRTVSITASIAYIAN